jgi:hypothetical protein
VCEPYWTDVGLPSAIQFLWHYYGLYPRLSVVWETIPLSFIVDMVIDIGTYLRQFESAPIQMRFKTISSGYSVKNTDTHEDQVWWRFNGLTDITGPAHLPGSTGRYSTVKYQRIPGPLDWDSSEIEPLQYGLPSLGQLGTIGALLISAFGRKGEG